MRQRIQIFRAMPIKIASQIRGSDPQRLLVVREFLVLTPIKWTSTFR